MAVVKKGNVAVQVVEVNRFFDPRSGAQTEIIYQGLEAAVEVVAAQAIGFGARSRTYQVAGPVYRASVLYGDAQDGSAEVPVDRWERVTEYIQEPITSNPNVLALAGGNFQTLAVWVQQIQAVLASSAPPTFVGDQLRLYNLYVKGQGNPSHELKRFVARRRRTISLTYAATAKANAVENVYTTARLVTAFGIPAATATKLPADGPAPPADFAWSWKERADNSQDVPAYNKTEEIKDWVFAQWSTILYNLQA